MAFLAIPDVKVIKPPKHADARGFFSETYNQLDLSKLGIQLDFVQDNHSLSIEKGTLRGLHFQNPPFAQDKLIRVIHGSIFDVAVDLRKNSSTYGKHVSTLLSANDWNQMLIPIGFAHGFLTLEANTEVIYKVSNYYSKEHDSGLNYKDPQLAIKWPQEFDIILSDKDSKLPFFENLNSPF